MTKNKSARQLQAIKIKYNLNLIKSKTFLWILIAAKTTNTLYVLYALDLFTNVKLRFAVIHFARSALTSIL